MYTIKKASELTGISAVTIRAWEQRYGALDPERTDKGQRLYTDRDIETLLWLKKETERGITISQAVRQLKEKGTVAQELAAPAMLPVTDVGAGAGRLGEGFPETGGLQESVLQQWQDRIYEELSNFHADAATGLLENAFTLFSFQDVFHRILTPIMHRAGEEWETGRLTVAQEHYISQYVYQRFVQFFRIFPNNPALPRFVAFCPSGEQHQLGLLLFVLFLRQYGVEVIYLGPDTPFDGLAELIRMKQIKHACVSLTVADHAERAEAMLNELQRSCPDLKVYMGGRGFEAVPERPGRTHINGGIDRWTSWFQKEIAGLQGPE